MVSTMGEKGSAADPVLLNAAEEITEGKVETNLAVAYSKRRLSWPWSGKSEGYLLIVGYKQPNSKQNIFQ